MKRLLAISVIVCIVITLVSCTTKLSGTYKNDDGLVSQSFTFDDDQVKMTAFGINVKGTYVIEDDKIVITYELLGISTNWKKSFKKKGNSIFIDGTEFKKED